ncbi:MAG TPA: hypothetical protein VM935_10330 [Chitinophagaceae bacterium]|nr:hypothetical protein [Chitinophagaceae bacterium]
MSNNAEVQITIYNANKNVAGIQTWKVSNVSKQGTGFQSTVHSVFVDEKGKEIAKSEGMYKCDGSKLMADMRMSLPQDQLQQNKMDAKLNDSYIEYPSLLSVGMALPDASVNMEMNNNGMPSTVQYEMKNRKVVGKETITSDAGTWEAYKISYDGLMRIKMAGIGVPVNMQINEWFVPNFGVVKSETFSKKGKMKGYSLLTKFKK